MEQPIILITDTPSKKTQRQTMPLQQEDKVTDRPNIKINMSDSGHWNDWETLSIPSPSSPYCKWTVSKTKKLRKKRKSFTRINEFGEIEHWECVPLYRIYVKKVNKAETQRCSPTSDELLQQSLRTLICQQK
jgi:hypothetical protein